MVVVVDLVLLLLLAVLVVVAAVLDLSMISLPMMEMLVDVHSTTKHSCNT